MTPEEWCLAYLMRFGEGRHIGYLEGEINFLKEMFEDLPEYYRRRDTGESNHFRAYTYFVTEWRIKHEQSR